jgi:hypothetical protein
VLRLAPHSKHQEKIEDDRDEYPSEVELASKALISQGLFMAHVIGLILSRTRWMQLPTIGIHRGWFVE